MANDIILAVGDGARRMTYTGLAAVRGISVASAERLVRRRWARQVSNDEIVRVLVPLTEAGNTETAMAADSLPDNSGTLRISGRMSPQISPLTSGPDDRTIRAPEASVDPLTQQ